MRDLSCGNIRLAVEEPPVRDAWKHPPSYQTLTRLAGRADAQWNISFAFSEVDGHLEVEGVPEGDYDILIWRSDGGRPVGSVTGLRVTRGEWAAGKITLRKGTLVDPFAHWPKALADTAAELHLESETLGQLPRVILYGKSMSVLPGGLWKKGSKRNLGPFPRGPITLRYLPATGEAVSHVLRKK